MSNRWLVNDCLGTIPGIRTLWHDLVEHCGCADLTGGYTPFDRLASKIERGMTYRAPDTIVRNATYFRRLNFSGRTISLAQDIASGSLGVMQADVIAHSDVVVFNSEYSRDEIGAPAGVRSEIIPLGTDLDLFRPPVDGEADLLRKRLGILPDSILFVGSSDPVKGWSLLRKIIDRSDMQFVVVTKDGARIDHPRVRNFGPIPQAELADIMRACAALVCTSVRETQHLAGIEAGACGLPVFAPNIGIYRQLPRNGNWGRVCDGVADFIYYLKHAINLQGEFTPREEFLDAGLDRATCMARWNALLDEVP